MSRIIAVVVSGALATGAALLAAPLPAAAVAGAHVSVRLEAGHIVVEGTDSLVGENVSVSLKRSSPGVGFWQISAMTPDFSTLPTDMGAGCYRDANPYMGYVVDCPTAGVTRIDVFLHGGPDMTIPDMDTYPELSGLRLPLYIDGGSGKDDLRGGPLDDEIHGGSGADDIMGDIGRDRLYGGLGDDTFEGDTRTLLAMSVLYADEFHGEDGVDTLHEPRAFGVTEYWSMDNVANDGANLDDGETATAGEGDNVFDDVENVDTSAGFDVDVVLGSAAVNRIDTGYGADVVRTLGGNDTINDWSGANYLDAGAGDDTILNGMGTLLGGSGNDVIHGTDSPETIDPGPGNDSIDAKGGNDVIKAADGARDVLNCGGGTDMVTTDASDVLPTHPGELCEYVMGPVGTPRMTTTLGTMYITLPGAGTMEVTVTAPVTTAGVTTAATVVLGRKVLTTTSRGKVRISVPWTSAGKLRARGLKMSGVVKLRFVKRGTTRTWAATSRAVVFKK